MRNHPLYRTWSRMIDRCHRPAHINYANYGGRGISVCERWRNSFEAFVADMGPRPDSMTLERIDNDGNYEPSNCCWATMKEQRRNTSRNMFLTVNGITLCQKDWVTRLRMGKGTILRRVRRYGLEATQQWIAEKRLHRLDPHP